MKKEIKKPAQLQVSDPLASVREFLGVIDQLRGVYEEETQALQGADVKKFFSLQDKKIAAAQSYHAGIAELMEHRNEILEKNPDIKAVFAKKHAEFTAAAAENMDALSRMRRTVERMGARIMKSARDAAIRESVNYGAKGHLSSMSNKPITMGLNESA